MENRKNGMCKQSKNTRYEDDDCDDDGGDHNRETSFLKACEYKTYHFGTIPLQCIVHAHYIFVLFYLSFSPFHYFAHFIPFVLLFFVLFFE